MHIERQFALTPAAPKAARDSLSILKREVPSRTVEDLRLMVSELVTNAVMHGVGAISLRIDVEADAVRVEVADEGNVALAPSPEPGAHGGWGLRIVEQLADDWGVLEGSTKVWFRLRVAPVAMTSPRVRQRRT